MLCVDFNDANRGIYLFHVPLFAYRSDTVKSITLYHYAHRGERTYRNQNFGIHFLSAKNFISKANSYGLLMGYIVPEHNPVAIYGRGPHRK